MLKKFYRQISVESSCFTTVYLTHAERRNSSERKKYCMSLIKTKRKALYPFCGYFNLVSKQDFSTFWLTEFCREGIFIGRHFMIYAKSFFCFDASKCCFAIISWHERHHSVLHGVHSLVAFCLAFRSSHWRCSIKNLFFKFLQYLQKNTSVESLFKFIKMRVQHRCSPMNIAKLLKNIF